MVHSCVEVGVSLCVCVGEKRRKCQHSSWGVWEGKGKGVAHATASMCDPWHKSWLVSQGWATVGVKGHPQIQSHAYKHIQNYTHTPSTHISKA